MSLERFSVRLKELMSAEKISQRGLSIKASVQRKSILNWLNGKYYPSYEALIKLSDYFNVSIGYLLGISDEIEGNAVHRDHAEPREVSAQFVNKLKIRMEKEKMTVYGLAKKLGMGQTTVTRWLKDGSMPETATLIKLASLMGETIEYLLSVD